MTTPDLPALRELLEKATRGPWKTTRPWSGFGSIKNDKGLLIFGLAAGTDDERRPETECTANAALIVTAVNALPDLLSTIEGQAEEIERLRLDKVRLDFLDECNARLNAKYGTTYRWRLILNHNVNRLMLGHLDVDLDDSQPNGLPSCRDAIDETRKSVDIARQALGGSHD